MSDPTDLPFQDDRSTSESIYEGERPVVPPAPDGLPPTQTDLLAARVTGPDDHVGMTALWRLTMDLGHWWFIAVGEEGEESPAAAVIQDQLMLLTFTTAERARHFAVDNGMIGAEDDLRAIALPPAEVVGSSHAYREADIGGLMFDPHISGYFIPTEQLPVVWDAVHSTASDSEVVTGEGGRADDADDHPGPDPDRGAAPEGGATPADGPRG